MSTRKEVAPRKGVAPAAPERREMGILDTIAGWLSGRNENDAVEAVVNEFEGDEDLLMLTGEEADQCLADLTSPVGIITEKEQEETVNKMINHNW